MNKGKQYILIVKAIVQKNWANMMMPLKTMIRQSNQIQKIRQLTLTKVINKTIESIGVTLEK